MRAEWSSTIGMERLTNYGFEIPSREQFFRELASNLPARPEYFLKDEQVNRDGVAMLARTAGFDQIEPAEGQDLIENGAVALDVRLGDQFATAHVPRRSISRFRASSRLCQERCLG